MANQKNKGNDGKRTRWCRIGKKGGMGAVGRPDMADEHRFHESQSGSQNQGIFCAIGHELANQGLPVTLGNCVGNLYPTAEICQECGICEEYISRYKQPDKQVVIKGEALYPHSPVDYEREMKY
jgi:hypothetical protein